MEIKGTMVDYRDLIDKELEDKPLGERVRFSVEYFANNENIELVRMTSEAKGKRYIWTNDKNENAKEPNGKLEITLQEVGGIPDTDTFVGRFYNSSIEDIFGLAGKIKIENLP